MIELRCVTVVPAGEPLRWRIGLRGEDWRDWELDQIEMRVEKLPNRLVPTPRDLDRKVF